MSAYSIERDTAIDAVIRASKLCQIVREEMITPTTLEKKDKSPVTVADFGAQALVCQHIKQIFPNDAIVAEEDAHMLCEHTDKLEKVLHYVQTHHADADAEQVCAWIDEGNDEVAARFWTLDPIDGTKGFLRNDQYAIALALIEDNKVKVGVLGCPALPFDEQQVGCLFVAVQGEGSQMASLAQPDALQPIHVADGSKPSVLRLVESVEHGNPDLQKRIAEQTAINQPPLKLDSQAKYGVIARGEGAMYLRLPSRIKPDYREKIWDHAAGSILVTEAGGTVTDMHGKALDFAGGAEMVLNQGIVASNGALHDAILTALASTQ